MDNKNCIRAQINAALWECSPVEFIEELEQTDVVQQVAEALAADAHAFATKDPASFHDRTQIVQNYTSFKAVLHYRLARAIALHKTQESGHSQEWTAYAALISSRGKLLSGAELHHRCRIGHRFILDHGVGTVIGETAEIGDDCYFLGGVTLGSLGISGNPDGKRHPTVGNRVQIGAFASLLGPILIGDDVMVGTHCTITKNISARNRVTLRSSLQIETQSMVTV